jgi:plastocyanin
MSTEQAEAEQEEVEPEPTDRPLNGSAAWPWLKDAGLVVFLVFFGASFLVLRSVGLDDATGSSGGAGGAASGPVEVSLEEFAILGNLESSASGGTLHIVNTGTVEHNLVIPDLGLRTANLAPGEEETLDLGRISARSYTIFCDLPGHRASGMEADLVVRS